MTTETIGNNSDDRDSDSYDEIENDTAEEERQQLEMAYGNPNRFHLVSVINPQAGSCNEITKTVKTGSAHIENFSELEDKKTEQFE